jgi:hypothetical protein
MKLKNITLIVTLVGFFASTYPNAPENEIVTLEHNTLQHINALSPEIKMGIIMIMSVTVAIIVSYTMERKELLESEEFAALVKEFWNT